ncbi:MAG: Gfo/Idh/MocA family oxidoreductase [Myxococcota bacterium]
MLRFAVCGAGRIGRVHAANIAAHPSAEVAWVLDVDPAAAGALAERAGGQAGEALEPVLDDVDAVLIGSPTPTHFDLIRTAAEAGKAIFCEKPVDLDLERVDAVVELVGRARVPFFVGFNRRFDPSFARLKHRLVGGEIVRGGMRT